MASATEIAYATAEAMANQITVLLDGGTVGGLLQIYDDTSTVPVDCEATNGTNVLLATIPLGDPAFPGSTNAAPGALLTLNGVPLSDTSAAATGVAAYFRGYSCSTSQIDANKVTCYIQGSAGEAADSTDLTLDDKNIVIGGTVTATAWTITIPEA